MTPKAQALFDRVIRRLEPAQKIKLSDWAVEHIRLPPGHSVRPGRYRNWPYLVEPMDAIGDDTTERVTILKAARIGYTKALAIAIGARAATNPGPAMLLMPTDEDASEIAADEIEPMFQSSRRLNDIIVKNKSGRTNLRNKNFRGGGSLKIRSGYSPRKLRRLSIRDLYVDEADGLVITQEGDALYLAEQRTRGYTDRKIVVGSTPTEEGISVTEREYLASDQRIFKVKCPKCSERSEIEWENIEWDKGPHGEHLFDTAFWRCPKCAGRVEEREKYIMVEGGIWEPQKPQVTNHKGYRLSALVSLLPKAAWRILAKEYVEAKREGPQKKQVFVNTVLGRPYRLSLVKVDADSLASRAENFGAPSAARGRRVFVVPEEVLQILAGADVQDDRIEVALLGFSLDGQPHILGHYVFEGNTLEKDVWLAFDRWHRDFSVKHPNGWRMSIDAMAVDSGGREGRTQVIYEFCSSRLARNIYAIKGDDGPNKKMFDNAKKIKGDVRLKIIGVDQVKTAVMMAYGREFISESGKIDRRAMRFSDSLDIRFYEQLTNEVRRTVYKDHRAVIQFKPKREGARTEALDCVTYAWALLASPAVMVIDLKARRDRRVIDNGASAEPKPERAAKPKAGGWAAKFNQR